MQSAYITTTGRAALALLVAAIVGPVILWISEIAFWTLRNRPPDFAGWPELIATIGALVAIGTPMLSLFLLFVGFPAWLALDVTGRRSWRWLVATGALLGFAVSLWIKVALAYVPSPRNTEGFQDGLVFDYEGAVVATPAGITAHGWWTALVEALPSALACALLGLVIWRIAYRRIAPT